MSEPIVAPAPGLFSTTTCWPRRLPSSCAITRIGPSTAPPGENGTTTLTGRDGYAACAPASAGASVHRANAAAIDSDRAMSFEPFIREMLTVGCAPRRPPAGGVVRPPRHKRERFLLTARPFGGCRAR